jgi:predicted heme/steroid binding protein
MDNHWPSETKNEKQTTKNDVPAYTKSQLALRNGQDRDEIWVSYQGLIYDVTRSRLWRRGNHYEHWAGQDLTKELDQDAPHTSNVFDKFPVIGRLK